MKISSTLPLTLVRRNQTRKKDFERNFNKKLRKALRISVHQFTAAFKKPNKKIRQIVGSKNHEFCTFAQSSEKDQRSKEKS